MRAVRSTTAGIEVVDVPEPDRSDGVRVRIRAAGICGSDLHLVERTRAKGRAIRVTLGHEMSGVLDDGTPVGIEPLAPCGSCDQCAAGNYHRCRLGAILIGVASDGGMADAVRVPERALVPLPPSLDVADASLIEPTAVALHGLRLAGASAGARVGVIGGGTIGLLAAAAAKAIGCHVGIVARHPAQLVAAAALGIGELRGEYDVAVEAAGSASAIDEAARIAAPGATMLVLGVHLPTLPVPGMSALAKELNVLSTMTYNAHGATRDVDDAADLLGSEPAIATAVITHRFELDHAAEAFAVAADRTTGAIKVVLEP